MKDTSVSIIVPIYNTEKYISQCIESLICQTLQNIEIILVDDGSSDNCPEICNQYALKDNRIKVIHKKNGGQSDARNLGLKIAKGQYIGFVDSDDYVAPDMFEKLYQKAHSENSDIAVCDLFLVKNEKIKKNSYWPVKNEKKLKRDQIYKFMFRYQCYPCNKIYKRSFIKKYNLRFLKGYIYEDVLFFAETMLKTNQVSYCKKPLYYYRLSENNTTTTIKSKKQLDIIHIVNMTRKIIDSHHLPKCVYKNFETWQIQIYAFMYKLLPNDAKLEALNAINLLPSEIRKKIIDALDKTKVKILLFSKFSLFRFETKRYQKLKKIFSVLEPIISIKKI